MTFLRLLPSFLSGVLLGAHFLRWGNIFLVLLSVAFPFMILARRRWAKIAVQCFLAFGTFVWLLVAWKIGQDRMAMGMPWIRMAVILSCVAAFNVAAALLLQGGRMRDWFRFQPKDL